MSNHLIRTLYIILLALAAAGCETLTSRATPPPKAQTEPPVLPFERTAQPPEAIDSELIYNYLAGEIGAQRGVKSEAYEHLMQAARQAKDPMAAGKAARLALSLENLQLADEATNLWVEYDPNALSARQLATILALRQGNVGKALEQAEATLKISEAKDKDGFLQLATVLAGEKSDHKITLMQQLVANHPKEARAHYALALVATQRNKFQLAQEALDEASRLDPKWDKPYLLRAQIHTLKGDEAAALNTLEEAADQHPSPFLLQAYGRLLMQKSKYNQALEQFREAQKLAPKDEEILYTIGVLALQTKKWGLAEESWRQLLKEGNFHKQQEAHYFLGQLEELQGRIEKAIENYSKVSNGRLLSDARLKVATLKAKRGQLEEARKLFRELRITSPHQAIEIYIAEAQLLKELGKSEAALTLYDEAVAANPDNTELLYARGLLTADLGRIDLAEKDFKRVLELDPDDADTLNALGYTLADQTERYAEAHDYIERALKKNPDSAAILDSMGWVLYRMGKLQPALEYLRKAADKLQDGEISAHLGEVLWVSGEREAARKVWNKALKHDPDHPKLKDVLQRFK